MEAVVKVQSVLRIQRAIRSKLAKNCIARLKQDVAAITAITGTGYETNQPGAWGLKFKDVTKLAGNCLCDAIMKEGVIHKLQYCDRCTDCLYRYHRKDNTYEWMSDRWGEIAVREADSSTMQNYVLEHTEGANPGRKLSLGPIQHSWVNHFPFAFVDTATR